MLDRFKNFWQSVMLAPFVNLFIRLGHQPRRRHARRHRSGVSAGALVFFPQGMLLTGVLFITAFIFSDLIDGAMARTTGRTSKFGAFFDSTLDRIGDGAIFGGLVLYFAGPGDSYLYLCLALYCLVMGAVTSLRPGQGGVARHAGQGRHRRARRPHRGHPGDDRARRLVDLPILMDDHALGAGASPARSPSCSASWMVRRQALADVRTEPDPGRLAVAPGCGSPDSPDVRCGHG